MEEGCSSSSVSRQELEKAVIIEGEGSDEDAHLARDCTHRALGHPALNTGTFLHPCCVPRAEHFLALSTHSSMVTASIRPLQLNTLAKSLQDYTHTL